MGYGYLATDADRGLCRAVVGVLGSYGLKCSDSLDLVEGRRDGDSTKPALIHGGALEMREWVVYDSPDGEEEFVERRSTKLDPTRDGKFPVPEGSVFRIYHDPCGERVAIDFNCPRHLRADLLADYDGLCRDLRDAVSRAVSFSSFNGELDVVFAGNGYEQGVGNLPEDLAEFLYANIPKVPF